MTLTTSQARGHATQRARADRRLAIIRRVSAEGGTIDDAAEAAGMTRSSAQSLLRRKLGTQVWPIATDD